MLKPDIHIRRMPIEITVEAVFFIGRLAIPVLIGGVCRLKVKNTVAQRPKRLSHIRRKTAVMFIPEKARKIRPERSRHKNTLTQLNLSVSRCFLRLLRKSLTRQTKAQERTYFRACKGLCEMKYPTVPAMKTGKEYVKSTEAAKAVVKGDILPRASS